MFFVGISLALIPAGAMTFLVEERERSLKHMQLISGMSLLAYWISNIVFDVAKGLITSAAVLGFMETYGVLYPNVWLSVLLYPIAVTPFTYATSFMFEKEALAQTFTIFLHFVFGGVLPIVTVILQLIESTYDVGDALHWALKIMPSFCTANTLAFGSSRDTILRERPDLETDSDNDIAWNGGNVVMLLAHTFFWIIVVCLIELGVTSSISEWIISMLNKNEVQDNPNDN